MRVAMYYNNKDVRIEDMPVPKPGQGEILVRVMASGVCGTDVLEWYRIKKAPIVLGHEIAGEIVELGRDVDHYKVGDRVFVSHHVPCNTCSWCLTGHHTACETLHNTNYFPGGFAEFIRVPALNVDRGVFVLPDEVSYEEGTFVEPLACVARGQRVADLQPGQTVLIIGSGISGLLHLALARSLGAGKVIAVDINDYRIKAAKQFGADVVVHARENLPETVRKINNGRLADLVIVCTGALPAFVQALESVDRGGTVLFFASTNPGVELPIRVDKLWRNDIKLMPSYGNSPLDASVAIELIRAGKIPVKKMITHRLILDQAPQAFRTVAEARDSIKVIIKPHN